MKSVPAFAAVAPNVSHPPRGAWIEIIIGSRDIIPDLCRTPRGVRGLKYRVAVYARRGACVAPPAGCVD